MLIKLIFIFIYLQYWSLNSRSSHWVTSPALFLWCVFFWDRTLRTICPGWLQTAIFLVSASWVYRFSGVGNFFFLI
jgi:hypothetical protein